MLRKGSTFTLNGFKWKVAYVNASRAHCVSAIKKPVTVVKGTTVRTFMATSHHTIDISPNTDLQALREMQQAVRS